MDLLPPLWGIYRDDSAPDETLWRLHHWIEHFRMTGVGLPVEQPERKIPDNEEGFHVSNHAGGLELLNLIRSMAPRVIIPIHTETLITLYPILKTRESEYACRHMEGE